MASKVVAVMLALLAIGAAGPAAALVPPLVASCFLQGQASCLPLNSYDCEAQHGRWTMDPCTQSQTGRPAPSH